MIPFASSVLALAADLAHRLAPANPDKEDVLASECIVIIDEVDLHLHPRWQQTVLADLIRTFPGAQFIVTTHSPQVVSTVPRDRIWILNDGVISPPPAQTRGAESQPQNLSDPGFRGRLSIHDSCR